MSDQPQGSSRYPQRPSHFAHKATRLLFKSCAAQEIGHHAVLLVIHIVHTEDAARYQNAVRFWNSQLMETLGFKSPKQLTEARRRAIDAGWLKYERDGTRTVGRYWVSIPPNVVKYDDSPIEEVDGILSDSGTNQNGVLSAGGTNSGMNCGTNCGKLSYPVPDPNPSSCSELSQTKASKPDKAAPGFESFPCVGPVKTWTLTAAKLAEWSTSFPDLDVEAEVRKARQWLLDNPQKRKTSRGMTRFLGAWLARAQDSGRGSRRDNGKPSDGRRDLTNDPTLRKPAHLKGGRKR